MWDSGDPNVSSQLLLFVHSCVIGGGGSGNEKHLTHGQEKPHLLQKPQTSPVLFLVLEKGQAFLWDEELEWAQPEKQTQTRHDSVGYFVSAKRHIFRVVWWAWEDRKQEQKKAGMVLSVLNSVFIQIKKHGLVSFISRFIITLMSSFVFHHSNSLVRGVCFVVVSYAHFKHPWLCFDILAYALSCCRVSLEKEQKHGLFIHI